MLSKSPLERQGDPADGFHIPDFLDRRIDRAHSDQAYAAWLEEGQRRDEAERQLISAIKVHIEKGDRCREKADQHYISAGQHLKTLKADHTGSWGAWQDLLRTRLRISTGRASELMQIADGRKTVAEVRDQTARRVQKHRSSPSLRNEEGEPAVETVAAPKIAAQRKLPSPKAANQQAKDEGRPVLASDGYIYFGTDPDKAKEGEDRRRMVYDVRDALDHLGTIQLTGRQFLDYALPHQLWTSEEAPIIKKALRWLADLSEAWEARTP